MFTVWAVFLHTFKANFRNLKSSGIMFALPLVFMGIFGLAFGGESAVEIPVGVVQGERESLDVGALLEESVAGTDNLNITSTLVADETELRERIEAEEFEIGLLIETPNANPQTFAYELIVPDGNTTALVNRAVLTELLTAIRFGEAANIPVSIVNPEQDNLSGFDYLAPGLMVYGLIILIPGIGSDFTRIVEKNQIFRYAGSRVKAGEIILGNTLFYLLVGVIQTVILYFTARAFGYQAVGSVTLTIVPALLVLLFVVAVGLLIGAFFRKTESATNVGTILSIILGFFSGSFIQGIGTLWEFDLFGRSTQFNELLPTTWGTSAFEQLLTRGRTLADVQLELAVLFVSGLVTILIGTFVYARQQLQFRA